MPARLPSTIEESRRMLSAHDGDLSRSRTLLNHLPLPIRPETIADQSRSVAELEAVAPFLGLPLSSVPGQTRD